MTISLVKFNFKFVLFNLVTILIMIHRCTIYKFFLSKEEFIAWKEREEEATYTTYVKDQSLL